MDTTALPVYATEKVTVTVASTSWVPGSTGVDARRPPSPSAASDAGLPLSRHVRDPPQVQPRGRRDRPAFALAFAIAARSAWR